MNTTYFRRITAYVIDLLLVFLTAWGFFFFSTQLLRDMVMGSALINLGQAQTIQWNAVFALFVVGPVPIFLSLLFLYATPGQYLRRLHQVDYRSSDNLNILQIAIHSFSILPSFLLGFLLQIYALWDMDRRTLVELAAGTRVDGHRSSPTKGLPKPLAIIFILIGLFLAFAQVYNLVTHTRFSKKGVVLLGNKNIDLATSNLLQSLQNTGAIPPNENAEKCFENVREALRKEDLQMLLPHLTRPAQIMVSMMTGKIDIFKDLEIPRDMQFVRKEDVNESTTKIYYREKKGSIVSEKEEVLTFIKEGTSWKLDLMALINLESIKK